MEKYNEYKKTYEKFEFLNYSYEFKDNLLEITYNFSILNLENFKTTWKIEIVENQNNVDKINAEKLEQLIYSLGMVELVSYWKLTCSPLVVVNDLTAEQIPFFKKLMKKGLGEFFYTNNISVDDDFVEFEAISDTTSDTTHFQEVRTLNDKNVLIPIGGGKDSTVTLEALKDDFNQYCYVINPRGATIETIKVAGLDDKKIFAYRTLDKKMLDLNKQGFLNGHTPFSAMVAFSSSITAYINGIKYVALSNESSANESTVKGLDVNHQYSKSFEFESDFINYEKTFINSGVCYFSFLRPLTELKIAQLFSKANKYFSVFKSCNVGSKEDIWCGDCSKCLFVYIIMSPFIEESTLVEIFGKNMLDDNSLNETFEKLIGLKEEKPFECVGSIEEVNIALSMTIKNINNNNLQMPNLLSNYKNEILKYTDNLNDNDALNSFDFKNFLPEEFEVILKNKVAN